jgi:hypothetical protein
MVGKTAALLHTVPSLSGTVPHTGHLLSTWCVPGTPVNPRDGALSTGIKMPVVSGAYSPGGEILEERKET